ncbi:DUF4145 domain-containing protein [Methylobacterium gnaphalii]|nr:DUF4145 domain-containing protein [Methylobacterium gnaphalii]
MKLTAIKNWPPEVDVPIGYANTKIKKFNLSASANCPACNRPVGAVVQHKEGAAAHVQSPQEADRLLKSESELSVLGYVVTELYPPPPEPRIPDHLPEDCERAFAQAERAFARKDTDAAGMMYRKSLEAAFKIVYPTAKGSLQARINALVKSHELPTAIGEWAHEVRAIGNDAAHEVDTLSEQDMIAARGFVDAVLRYAISLPKEIELRRAETVVAGAASAELAETANA